MSSLAPALAKTAAQAVPVVRTPSPFVQRKCSCGGSAGMSGSCAGCDQERRFGVQTKMRVNAPGDRYEHEADALAGEVMRLPAAPFLERAAVGPSEDDGAAGVAGATGPALHRRISPLIQRQEAPVSPLEAEEEDKDKQQGVAQMRPDDAWRNLQRRAKTGEEEDDKDKLVQTRVAGNALAQRQATAEDDEDALQRRTARRSPGNEPTAASEQAARPAAQRDASGAFDPGPTFEAGLAAAQSSGAALEPTARAFMETRFGLDFSRVRIHADERAAALASAVHAEAFTVGQDIFFAPGRYDPRSTVGRELIAHELVHTVQQDGARPRRARARQVAVAAAARHATRPQYRASNSVQRQDTFVPADFRGTPKTWRDNHEEVFKQFGADDKNGELFTEVKIPGAKKYVHELDKKGVADLYKVAEGNKTTIAVIMAADEPAFLESDRKLRKGDQKFSHKAEGAPRGVDQGEPSCTISGGDAKKVCRLDVAPQEILIGDLKPASLAESILGEGQINDYQTGIENTSGALNTFIQNNSNLADPAGRKWHPKTRPLASGEVHIPLGLRYGKSNTQQDLPLRFFSGRPGEAIPGLIGRRTVYKHPTIGGIWVYEWIPTKLPKGQKSDRFLDAIDRLYKLIAEINKSEKVGQGKPAKGIRSPFKRHSLEHRVNLRPRLVQRKAPAAQGFNGETWHRDYNKWKNETAEPFLKSEQANNVEVIATLAEVKKHSGLPLAVPAAADKTAKDYKRLKLWFRWGSVFGRLRAALGPLFVKIHTFYEKAKERFEALRQSKTATDEGGSKIVQSVVRAGFKAASSFFKLIIHRVTDNLKRALKRGAEILLRTFFGDENVEKVIEAQQDLELLAGNIEQEGKAAVEDRIKKVLGPYQGVLNVITTVTRWVGEIGKIEQIIRWGVRIIQCLTPPGVGCLKLIFEFLFRKAIERLVDRVTATCWFQQNFILPALRAFDTLKGLPNRISGFILDQVKEMLPFEPALKEKLFPTEQVSEEVSSKDLECTHEMSKEAFEMNRLADRYGPKKLKHLIDILEKGGAGVNRPFTMDDVKNFRGLLEKMQKGELTDKQIEEALKKHTPTDGFGDPLLDKFMADFKAGGVSGGGGTGAGKGSGPPNVPAAKANKPIPEKAARILRSNACVSPALPTHREGQELPKITVWGEWDDERVQSVSGVPVMVLASVEGSEKGKRYRWLRYQLKQNVAFDQFTSKDIHPFGYKAGEWLYGCEKYPIEPGASAGGKP